mmetsp:Transcript_106909/g.180511  ORF Transcript_106909/g.180511 Transcript_106909/m.180511 type:complete len:83 (+) Transcript_106909:209-457(+)
MSSIEKRNPGEKKGGLKGSGDVSFKELWVDLFQPKQSHPWCWRWLLYLVLIRWWPVLGHSTLASHGGVVTFNVKGDCRPPKG